MLSALCIVLQEVKDMRKLNSLVFFTALFLLFPISVLSWEDEAAVNLEGGIIESSEAYAVNPSFLKDEYVQDIEDEYAAYLTAILDEIQDETDPLERERLQKEGQEVKQELEIKVKELQLEIAIEQGDEDRAIEIQEALNQLYWPKDAESSVQEHRQKPDPLSKKTKDPVKNPDDV